MTKTYRLTGLCCANCAAKIERLVGKLDTVQEATLNFMTSKLIVDIDDTSMGETEEKIMDIVKKVEPDVVVTRG